MTLELFCGIVRVVLCCVSSFMASSTTPTLPLAFPQRHHSVSHRQVLFFAKFSNKVSLSSSVASKRSCKSKCFYAKVQNALNEEAVETQSSELEEDTQSTPSSSKLVLVVGGSGGVGKHNLSHSSKLFVYKKKMILLYYCILKFGFYTNFNVF